MPKIDKSKKADIDIRLGKGESLRSIAKSYGVSYQTLQYHRRIWGDEQLRPAHTSGQQHASWRGGTFVDQWGYKMVRKPDSNRCNPYSPEHILVAEQAAGRLLSSGEVVHHINGDKQDNRPENLLICSRSDHRKLHARLEEIAYELLRDGVIEFRDGTYHRVK